MLEIPAVIFDNGSGLCKCGVGGDSVPRAVITSIVGHSKAKVTKLGAGHKEDCYIGDKAQAKRGLLTLKCPVEQGFVTCWDDMEKIWRHAYECELKMKPSERPVLLSEAPLNPQSNREMMTEIMFESFKVPAMYVSVQAVLALYASGRTTGLVIDSGDGVTHTVPIYEGYYLPHAVSRLGLAGRDITEYLMRLLLESGHSVGSSEKQEIVKDIKEKLCYVAADLTTELKKNPKENQREYRLPDGNAITITDQLFKAPEALFLPALVRVEAPGLHKMTFNSVLKCDSDVRNNLFSNVLLCGGSTLFPGLEERMLKEIREQIPSELSTKVIAPLERKYIAWTGASFISCLTAFKQMWITAMDYKEFGPTVVHRKCY
ncbi:ACT1 protein, partial [Polyodon spathula]|nr:ACT1 protein [Polyodon spathula]